ncbi:STAS domain-containing protein [Pseudonocardia lutea]|jgi:anti-anti-sigma factor|uniref:STAS domain-containing protein n=1 Tax=Pseudonocardia lutea TaxID=2172015 RepID=A0ABW1I1B7_9PSEU
MAVFVRALPGLVVRQAAEPGAATVVTVEGEIDLRNCDDLALVLAQVADDPAAGPVVVDLTAVCFLAACGLRCLAQVREKIEQNGGRISLVVGPGPGGVRRLLDLVGGFDLVGCAEVGGR